jgi:hypothetical protein
VVWEWPVGPDSGLKITLRAAGARGKTLASPPGDHAPKLVEIAWQEDAVGVLICDGVQSNAILAYRLTDGSALPESPVITVLRKQLVSRYDLGVEDLKRYDGDPIGWACNSTRSYKRFTALLRDGVLPSLKANASP